MTEQKPSKSNSILTFVLVALLVGTSGAAYYEYSQYQGASRQLSDALISIGSNATNAGGNIIAQVQALESTIVQDQQTIASLKSQLAATQQQLQADSGTVSSLQSQIDGLSSQLSSVNSEVQPLENDLTGATAEISDLQDQLFMLASELGLQMSSNEYQQTLQGIEGQDFEIASFSVRYAGYLTINGTSTSSGFYVIVTDSFGGYPLDGYQYQFGSGTSLIVPVLPGQVTLYVGAPCGVLGCTLSGGNYSATLTVTYVG